MRRLWIALIGLATPRRDREWVVGDTLEELEQRQQTNGSRAANRWLRDEARRVCLAAPRHRLAARRSRSLDDRSKGDGAAAAFRQDLRYALRLLGRSPGFAVIAIVTLALGIGANTAMFAVVNGVLLKPLPFADPDRLMLLHLTAPDRESPGVFREMVWSYPKFRTLLGIQQVFDDAALFSGRDLNLSGDGDPERVRGEIVTDRYPEVLGIKPMIGRAFTSAEANSPGASPVAMLGYGLWVRRYGSDASVLGRGIYVNAVKYTIVGVLPRVFRGLSGDAQIWVPLGTYEPSQLTGAHSHSYFLVARRKPNIPEESAIAAVRVAGAQIDAAHSGGRGGTWGASAASLYASRADADVRRGSFVLLAAVGFVLLIACVNLTNLVGARAIARRREVAVRVAIGASRARIVWQFLAEGAVLAASGAVAGLFVAWALLAAAGSLLPDSSVFFRTAIAPTTPRTFGAAGLTRIGASLIELDTATLLFTCGIAMVTAIVVSLVPALQASSPRPVDVLKAGAKGVSGRGFQAFAARTILVTAQIALALVLLAGAGLMVKSVARLYRTSIGITPDRVLTARLDLPGAAYSRETGAVFFEQVVERVRRLPGVEAVGLGNCVPVSGGCNATGISFPNAPTPPGQSPLIGIYWATPEYFESLGIRLLSGRMFTDRDRVGQPKVVLVNEAAARAFWPNASAIGQVVAVGQGNFGGGAEVIGVVANVRYRAIESAPMPDVYLPVAQSYQSGMRLFVRSRLDPQTLVPALTREVKALDPNLPVSEIKTMDERIGEAMWRTRVGAWLLSAFASLALLLTGIGIFGVMAQTVVHRTAEIGLRMALGAQRHDVLRLVLGRAAAVTTVGLGVGVGCALGLTRLIRALLFDVKPNDPLTFVAVVLLLGGIAMIACYIPARRATRVDAMTALRAD